jgi:hypothetical protein
VIHAAWANEILTSIGVDEIRFSDKVSLSVKTSKT